MISESRRYVKTALTHRDYGGESLTYKEAREKAGLTQDEAAKRIGVSRVSIWLWETGRGNPLISSLVKMAEVYDVPVSSLDVVTAPQSQGQEEFLDDT